jgi:hypothetical protein
LPELLEGVGEHALGDAGDLPLQVGVAQRAVLQDRDDERAPFVADPVQDLADEGHVLGRDARARTCRSRHLRGCRALVHPHPLLSVAHTCVPFVPVSILAHDGVTNKSEELKVRAMCARRPPNLSADPPRQIGDPSCPEQSRSSARTPASAPPSPADPRTAALPRVDPAELASIYWDMYTQRDRVEQVHLKTD